MRFFQIKYILISLATVFLVIRSYANLNFSSFSDCRQYAETQRNTELEVLDCPTRGWKDLATSCSKPAWVEFNRAVNECRQRYNESEGNDVQAEGAGEEGAVDLGAGSSAADQQALENAKAQAAKEKAEAEESARRAAEAQKNVSAEAAKAQAQSQVIAQCQTDGDVTAQKLTPEYKAKIQPELNQNVNKCIQQQNPASYPWTSYASVWERDEKEYYDEQLKKKYDSELSANKCETDRKVAEECCANPESCFGKADGEYTDKDEKRSQYSQLFAMLRGTALNFPASSISAMCGKMKQIGNVTAGLNLYLGERCGGYVRQCKSSCNSIVADIKSNPDCQHTSDGCRAILSDYEVSLNDCATYDNQTLRMRQQAAVQVMSSKFADMCENASKSSKPDTTTGGDLFANPDCSNPTAAATPFCQAKCTQPGAASDPSCAGFPGLNNGGPESNIGLLGGSDNPFSGVLPGEDEGTQGAVTPDIAAAGNRSTGGQGGGGSAGLGGGGGAGGGGDEGSQGYGGGGGYDTGILKGTQSGNGYSSVGGTLRSGTGGGFSGYGGGRAITDKGKPFNLKDYLPGGNKTKPTFRGLASASADIAPAHADIFKKVTDRFYQVCLRNALYDCATLQKIKKLGN